MAVKKKDVRILIVDDDENVREIMSYVFEKRGFVTDDSKNGKEALQKIAMGKPNIIILDLITFISIIMLTMVRIRPIDQAYFASIWSQSQPKMILPARLPKPKMPRALAAKAIGKP